MSWGQIVKEKYYVVKQCHIYGIQEIIGMYDTKHDMIHAIKSYYRQWKSTSDNKPFKVYHYINYDLYTIRKTYGK